MSRGSLTAAAYGLLVAVVSVLVVVDSCRCRLVYRDGCGMGRWRSNSPTAWPAWRSLRTCTTPAGPLCCRFHIVSHRVPYKLSGFAGKKLPIVVRSQCLCTQQHSALAHAHRRPVPVVLAEMRIETAAGRAAAGAIAMKVYILELDVPLFRLATFGGVFRGWARAEAVHNAAPGAPLACVRNSGCALVRLLHHCVSA